MGKLVRMSDHSSTIGPDNFGLILALRGLTKIAKIVISRLLPSSSFGNCADFDGYLTKCCF
jgi:hypothetical protein